MREVIYKFLVHFFHIIGFCWKSIILTIFSHIIHFWCQNYQISPKTKLLVQKNKDFSGKQKMTFFQCFRQYFFPMSPSINCYNRSKPFEVRNTKNLVCLLGKMPFCDFFRSKFMWDCMSEIVVFFLPKSLI